MARGLAAARRTCVGCRVCTVKSDLLRLVAVEGVLVPDLGKALPGRGASIHPDLGCLELAERRRAFPRAFRLPGPLDSGPLREHLEALRRPDDPVRSAMTEE